MIKPKVVLLIFISGKIVLTGAKVKFYLVLLVFTLSYKFYYLFICLGLDVLMANLLRLIILIFLHFLIDQFTK